MDITTALFILFILMWLYAFVWLWQDLKAAQRQIISLQAVLQQGSETMTETLETIHLLQGQQAQMRLRINALLYERSKNGAAAQHID
jgi:hypothetical protein